MISCVSKGLRGFGGCAPVGLLLSCAPPKLEGGEWNVVVGEMLRLCDTVLSSLSEEGTMSLAGVAIFTVLWKRNEELTAIQV